LALIGEPLVGETPLTAEDLQGLRLSLVTTRSQLSAVEAPNIVSGKQWALNSRRSRMPHMLSIDYMLELHRQMLCDVWHWAGEIRSTELHNAYAAPTRDIRAELARLYSDAVEHWLTDMNPDEFAVRVHHRVVKIHPFRDGNGRHSRLLADVILERHFKLVPFTWGGNTQLSSDPYRPAYLRGLKAADRGDYRPLMALCRASSTAQG
jgi:Fic-DOC domain mobile mystery protein B